MNPESPALAIFDRAALRALEIRGFEFGEFVFGLARSTQAAWNGRTSASELMSDAGYAAMVSVLGADIAAAARGDSHAGVGIRYAHRLFDTSWFSSSKFHYELVAVINRVDRKVFAAGTCGELRLIYRLAYQANVGGQAVASRLPMTVNVVRRITDADCRGVLASWKLPSRSGEAAANALTSAGGPLSADSLRKTEPKSVEVNLQSVRWPSTVRPNMAGHAEYLLRVFRPIGAGGVLIPTPLENSPDVDRLRKDARLKAELLSWLKRPEVLQAVDQGTVRIPTQFLAPKATSVAPHGLARLANRPFSQLFSQSHFNAVNWMELKYQSVRGPAELLRRLDGLSCQGCHQSRSSAGFHVLGRDAPGRKADVLSMPHSPHFTDDLRRRDQYAAELGDGRVPAEFRPFAERVLEQKGWGEHCGLSAQGEAFSAWDCGEGLQCVQLSDPQVGQCQPLSAGVGDACEGGNMRSNASSHRDFVSLDPPSSCGTSGVCERNAVGFPAGMCAGSCQDLPAQATCGGIAVLSSFSACLAQQRPFERCLLDNTRPGALRRCSHGAPCREDYVCARTAAGVGACLPPYFLFQLRVDGHVIE